MVNNMARDYLERARSILSQASQSFEEENWAMCITRSAEATEYSLKAAIRSVGGDYRPEHDVSRDLVKEETREKFPAWFQRGLPGFV